MTKIQMRTIIVIFVIVYSCFPRHIFSAFKSQILDFVNFEELVFAFQFETSCYSHLFDFLAQIIFKLPLSPDKRIAILPSSGI